MAAWADGGANDICPRGFSVPTEAELARGEGSNKHPKDFLKAKKPLTFPSVTLLLNPEYSELKR
jgi:hypothetical protein